MSERPKLVSFSPSRSTSWVIAYGVDDHGSVWELWDDEYGVRWVKMRSIPPLPEDE